MFYYFSFAQVVQAFAEAFVSLYQERDAAAVARAVRRVR